VHLKYRTFSLSFLTYPLLLNKFLFTKPLGLFFKRPKLGFYVLKSFVDYVYTYNYVFSYKPLLLRGFLENNKTLYKSPKVLLLNFKRNRFFPSLKLLNGETYLTLSLGLFSSFFHKGKFFIKNKAVYLVLASFLRKILIYSSFKELILFVLKTPIYLQELLSTINSPVINFYKHPFNDTVVNENNFLNRFYFSYFIFSSNKPYNFIKTRKKGRVKRKISKRVTSINRLTD